LKNRKKIFSEIVAETRKESARILWNKAYIYNQLARISKASSRKTAYRFKTRCLKQLLEKFHQYAYAIQDDIVHDDPGLRLVRLRGQKGGLHTHDRWINEVA